MISIVKGSRWLKSSLKNNPESFLLCQFKSAELENFKFPSPLQFSLKQCTFSMLAGKPGASEKPKGLFLFFFLVTFCNVENILMETH